MKARFVTSAARHDRLPAHGLAEIAFVGRSNVGKSTLLGTVLGQPKLVRTSRTPGRTQLLNLFELDGRLALVDLPGYGYARLSKGQRAQLDAMVQDYLRERGHLRGVVQVVDARREPVSELDAYVARWILEQGRPLLVALTKIDLIPKNRRQQRAKVVEEQLGVPRGASVVCSGKSGEGCKELARRLWEMAG